MFVHEARAALLPVEAALLVVNAACGVEAMTRRVWKFGEEFNLPRAIVVNQMDHPRADRERTMNALREAFGRQVVPVQLPILEGTGQNPIFRGVVDLVTMEAFVYGPDGTGCGHLSEIPVRLREEATAAHQDLVELVAEGKDELMEEYFREGTIPQEHLIVALHEAIREDRIFPVLFASGLRNVGSDHLLDFLEVYAPAPVERVPVAARGAVESAGRAPSRPLPGSSRLQMGSTGTLLRPATPIRWQRWCCARWMIANRCRCTSSRPCLILLLGGSLSSRFVRDRQKRRHRHQLHPPQRGASGSPDGHARADRNAHR